MLRNVFSAALFLISSISFSQDIALINSGEVIRKGKALYDSAKYSEAIKEFLKVPERDTNYVYMLSEVTSAYIGAKDYDTVLSVCEQQLKKATRYAPLFLRYKAVAYDKSGQFDKAVDTYQEAIKKYPADYNLLFNLGIAYYNHKNYEEAAAVFFKVLSIHPFHAGSHLNLGRMAIGQGRKVHAMLSFGMYLSISNTDNPNLVLLNNFLDNQVTDEGSLPLFGTNEPEKLDQIIRAKIAMDRNFKSMIPVDAVIVRQYEMLFQQFNSIQSETDDLWIRSYYPIYKFIIDNGLIEPFIYHLLNSSANTTAKKWLSKNGKTLTSFFQSVNGIMKQQREVVSLPGLGFNKPVHAWYSSQNNLEAVGDIKDDKVRQGHWNFFHDNFQLSAIGDYNEKGIKKSVWKYYNNDGTIKSIENYDSGEVNMYFPDGTKREHFFLKNDEIHGEVELFHPCGPLKEKLQYQAGNREGAGQTYHPTGELNSLYRYTGNKATGEYRVMYPNGEVATVSHYLEDVLSGKYQSFYLNGNLKSDGNYSNGNPSGAWTYYYSNGQKERAGYFDTQGRGIGEWLYYDKNGLLTEKRIFDEEGRLHGANTFYSDNKVYYIHTYKKDVLIQAAFYNSEGKEISKNGGADGTFGTKNYFNTGQLKSEGDYKKGKANGRWKYYNRYGRLLTEYDYVEDMIQGKAVTFFPSGEKKFITEYRDNKLHGYFREFYRNGSVKQEGWYQNGNREQQWLTYYPDGTLETDSYYLLDALTGKYYSYALDGKLQSVWTYDNNKILDLINNDSEGNVKTARHNEKSVIIFEEKFASAKPKSRIDVLCGNYTGTFTRWYPDDVVYFSYTYLNGEKNGRYLSRHANGKTSREGAFVDGNEEGVWKNYYYTGQLSSEGRYLNGDRDSVWNFYNYDGNLSSAVVYKSDEPHGEAHYYSPHGVPWMDKLFDNGDLIAYRIIKPDGETGSWLSFSGTGTITLKNSSSQVVYEETFKDGLRHGIKRSFFDNNKLFEETHFDMGDLSGPYVINYPSGNLFIKGTYEQDEVEGKLEMFSEGGAPIKTEQFKMGSPHGIAIYYFKGGESKELTFWDSTLED